LITLFQVKIIGKMKKYILVIIFIIGSLALNAQNNKQQEHSILKELVDKKWIGNGVLMDKEATFNMQWQNVLDNTFLKLEFKNKRKSDTNEIIIFKATAFYKIVNDTEIVGNWFDNRGITFPLKGTIKKNELTILWENDEIEKGKTIYHYIKDRNELIVEDFIMINEKYTEFGKTTYKIIE